MEFPFSKYYFGHTAFLSGHHPLFLISDFLPESLKANKKVAKKITNFTTVSLKKLTHFPNLNSLDVESDMLPQHSQKPFSLYKFSSKHVTVWCQKKYLLCTISWRPGTAFLKHFESKGLYIPIYLPKKNFFRRRSKVERRFIWWGGLGASWISFSRRLAVWALQNFSQSFILIDFFKNSAIF